MKLTRLQYEGFKALRPVVVDATKPILIIGTNRCGKSGVIEMAKALATGGVDAPVGSESDLFRFSPTGEVMVLGQFQDGDGTWTLERSWNARKSPQKEIAINGQKVKVADGQAIAESKLAGFKPGLSFKSLYECSATERKRWLLSLFSPDETTVADMLGRFVEKFTNLTEALPEEDYTKTEILNRRFAILSRFHGATGSPFERLTTLETTLRDEKNKAVQSARNKTKAVQEIMRSIVMTTTPVAGGANGVRVKIDQLAKQRDEIKARLATLQASLEAQQDMIVRRDEIASGLAEPNEPTMADILETEHSIAMLRERLAEIGDAESRLKDLESAWNRIEAQRDAARERSEFRAGIQQSIREAEEEYSRLERGLVPLSDIVAKEAELERVETQLREARGAADSLEDLKAQRMGCELELRFAMAVLEFVSDTECGACGSVGDFRDRRKAKGDEQIMLEQRIEHLESEIRQRVQVAAQIESLTKRASDLRSEITRIKERNRDRLETMAREEQRIAGLREQLAAIAKDSDGIDIEIDRIETEMETEKALLNEAETIRDLIHQHEQDLAVYRNDLAHQEKRQEEIRAELNRLSAIIADFPDLQEGPLEAELGAVETELEAWRECLEQQIEREKGEKDMLRLNAEKTVEERWAKIAEEMMEFVGPKGLMRELLEAAISPLVADVSNLLQKAGFVGTTFAVRFYTEGTDTCDIGVQRRDTFISEINGDPNKGFIDYSAMSASEQLVFATCLAMGLAPKAKAEWKPLFLKDLTLLVGEFRQRLMDLLTVEAGRFDNVFVEEAVAEPGLSSVRIDANVWNIVDMEPYNQWVEA